MKNDKWITKTWKNGESCFSWSQLKEQEKKTTQTRWSLHRQVATMEENSEKSTNEGSPRSDYLNFSKPRNENRNKIQMNLFLSLNPPFPGLRGLALFTTALHGNVSFGKMEFGFMHLECKSHFCVLIRTNLWDASASRKFFVVCFLDQTIILEHIFPQVFHFRICLRELFQAFLAYFW